MKHFSLFFLLVVVSTCKLFAVPARPLPFNITQRDGSVLTVFLRGDELFHYRVTEDNVPIVMGVDSSFYYADIRGDILQPSTFLAHNVNLRNTEETEYLESNVERLRLFIQKEWDRRISDQTGSKSRLLKTRTTTPEVFKGAKKGIVILVNFADLGMSVPDSQNAFHMQCNQEGYNKDNHIGSAHDFFYDCSYGQFNLTFDVVGPVTVSKPYEYYGQNATDAGSDMYPEEMVKEACALVDKYVDFSDYDWDGDGEVEQVFVIFAGHGEASNAPSNTIWPHKSALQHHGTLPVYDGVKINTYACSSELAGNTGVVMNGIGTLCHEYSHCLGLPDFYDTDYSGGFGMDAWDVMCSGSYNGPNHRGEAPCGYTAYERWCLGWMDLITLNDVQSITNMPPLNEQPVAYIVYNNGYEDEYLILENRQNVGWNSYVNTTNDCHGLLVYHVDYSQQAWENNTPNNIPYHQRMSVIPADNRYGEKYSSGYDATDLDLAGDAFPGKFGVTELTNDSHVDVGGLWFNLNNTGDYCINQPIINIKEENGLISFDFMGGIVVPTPKIIGIKELSTESFTIDWTCEEPVDSFIVEVQECKSGASEMQLINESFTAIKNVGISDGTTNVSISINSYTSTSGWIAKRIYTSPNGVKVGNETVEGYLTTPYLESEQKNITVKCVLKGGRNVYMALIDENKDTVSVHTLLTTTDKTTSVFSFEDLAEGKYRIGMYGDSCFYVSSIATYDGIFAADELTTSALTKPAATNTYSGITENYFTVEGLKGQKYNVRLKAMFSRVSSPWSDYVEVALTDQTGIIYVGDETTSPHVRIYNLNGVPVKHPQKNTIYIVVGGNNRRRKILLQ